MLLQINKLIINSLFEDATRNVSMEIILGHYIVIWDRVTQQLYNARLDMLPMYFVLNMTAYAVFSLRS